MKIVIVNHDQPEVAAMHQAIVNLFGCDVRSIYSITDTPQKKLAVFILSHFMGYSAKDIAGSYIISYCYVPTVVKKHIEAYAASEAMRKDVMYILNFIEMHHEAA